MQRRASLAFVALIAAVALGCAATTVNKILADPSKYRNRDVTISGSVTQSMSLLNRGAYRLEDRTGQIWVVSTTGVPRTGARVQVTGTIRDGYDLGSLGDKLKLPPGFQSGLVLVEKSHKARD